MGALVLINADMHPLSYPLLNGPVANNDQRVKGR